jgi:hypothetical protein
MHGAWSNLEKDTLTDSLKQADFALWEVLAECHNKNIDRLNKCSHTESIPQFPLRSADEVRDEILNSRRIPAPRPWTCEEDENFRNYILDHYDAIDWEQCALALADDGKRTAQECSDHYKLYLMPFKNGPWHKREDQLLEEKHTEFEETWAKIALFFWGRSPLQLAKRHSRLIGNTPPAKDWIQHGKYSQPHFSDCSEEESECDPTNATIPAETL